jgi:hypothetical protein
MLADYRQKHKEQENQCRKYNKIELKQFLNLIYLYLEKPIYKTQKPSREKHFPQLNREGIQSIRSK